MWRILEKNWAIIRLNSIALMISINLKSTYLYHYVCGSVFPVNSNAFYWTWASTIDLTK